MTISADVARVEDELRIHQSKAESDEHMIALLKEQNSQLSHELEQITTKCAEATRRLSQERDEAVRRATEVSGILNQAAEMVISGIRKMKGDEIAQSQIVAQIRKTGDTEVRLSRLPKVEMSQ